MNSATANDIKNLNKSIENTNKILKDMNTRLQKLIDTIKTIASANAYVEGFIEEYEDYVSNYPFDDVEKIKRVIILNKIDNEVFIHHKNEQVEKYLACKGLRHRDLELIFETKFEYVYQTI